MMLDQYLEARHAIEVLKGHALHRQDHGYADFLDETLGALTALYEQSTSDEDTECLPDPSEYKYVRVTECQGPGKQSYVHPTNPMLDDWIACPCVFCFRERWTVPVEHEYRIVWGDGHKGGIVDRDPREGGLWPIEGDPGMSLTRRAVGEWEEIDRTHD